MLISAITIENFKGIKGPARVELKPITLLFGPNSAGKSTVVQVLHYAREIFSRHNLNPDKTLLGGNSIDLGGFESMVYEHDLSLPIRMRFDLDLSQEELPLYFQTDEVLGLMTWEQGGLSHIPSWVESGWVEISIEWSQLLEKPLLTSYRVGINGKDLAAIETSEDGRQINLTTLKPFNPVFLGDLDQDKAVENFEKVIQGEELSDEEESFGDIFPLLMTCFNIDGGVPGITKNIPLAGQQSAIPKRYSLLELDSSIWSKEATTEERENLTSLLTLLISGPGELISDALSGFCYVGPLREVPQRGHRPVISPEASRWSNGLAAYDRLFYAEDGFIQKVNNWLTSDERLGSDYEVEVKKYRELKEDDPLILALLQDRLLDEEFDFKGGILKLPLKRRLLIRDVSKNVELEPQDIGVGISQVLPVIVAALNHKSGLVAIEQPELHIHPAFQVALGDLFIEQVRENPGLFFILETHSEHLLLRLLRRIRETAEGDLSAGHPGLTPEYLSINFIDRGQDEGTCIRSLAVSNDGDSLGQWPEGFFEERAGELF